VKEKFNLEEELFCIKYEIDAFKELFINSEAERWVHGFCDRPMETQHINRYIKASTFIENKKVLDIAGGSGYGSYYMALNGKPLSIDTIDIDEEAVKYANYRYPHEKINRNVGNAETFVKPKEYDVIISFETIEHLEKYFNFLENISNSIKEGGTLIISTPINSETTNICNNPYHKIEWSFVDFQELINKDFEIQETYLQNVVLKKDKRFFRFKSLLRKILNKGNKLRPDIEKYEGQYSKHEIVGGLQLIIAIKK
jgi:cyclopropane fatty-acyl-phospholipid synthase-like methyltransferase